MTAGVLVLLVLVLPGYAVAAIAFPPGSVSPAERGVYAVALSIAVAAVGGLVLQLAVGLDRTVWAVFLASVTLLAAIVAMELPRRRRPLLPVRLPRAFPLVLASFGVACLVAVLAVVSARDGLLDSRSQAHFTDFWMTPAATGSKAVTVGLRRHGDGRGRYAVRLLRGSRTLARREVVLRAGQQRVWTIPVLAPGPARVVAAVEQRGRAGRRLHLELGG